MTESGVIEKTAFVFGQMNEPPGARQRVGLTAPDDGRVLPRRGRPRRPPLHRQHLPLHPGRLGSLRAARPNAFGGGLPAEPGHRDGGPSGAHHLDQEGLDHVAAGRLRAGGRLHRPGAGDHVRPSRLRPSASSGPSPSWASIRQSIRSRPRPACSIRWSSARSTTTRPAKCSASCSVTATCRTSSRSSASTSYPRKTRPRSREPGVFRSSTASRSTWPRSSPAGRECTWRSATRWRRSRRSWKARSTTCRSRPSSWQVPWTTFEPTRRSWRMTVPAPRAAPELRRSAHAACACDVLRRAKPSVSAVQYRRRELSPLAKHAATAFAQRRRTATRRRKASQ